MGKPNEICRRDLLAAVLAEWKVGGIIHCLFYCMLNTRENTAEGIFDGGLSVYNADGWRGVRGAIISQHAPTSQEREATPEVLRDMEVWI